MVTKLKKSVPLKANSAKTNSSGARSAQSAPDAASPLANAVKDSAQQIWQAGLGAFHRAQAEGSKAFEALVKEGVTLQRKTQSAAEDKIAEAANKMSSIATDMSAKATGQWDKLETIFEDRVAKALGKLGVPSAQDLRALTARIAEPNKSVQQRSAQAAASPRKKPAARRATPRKAASAPI